MAEIRVFGKKYEVFFLFVLQSFTILTNSFISRIFRAEKGQFVPAVEMKKHLVTIVRKLHATAANFRRPLTALHCGQRQQRREEEHTAMKPTEDEDLLSAVVASRSEAPVSAITSTTSTNLEIGDGASPSTNIEAGHHRRVKTETNSFFGALFNKSSTTIPRPTNSEHSNSSIGRWTPLGTRRIRFASQVSDDNIEERRGIVATPLGQESGKAQGMGQRILRNFEAPLFLREDDVVGDLEVGDGSCSESPVNQMYRLHATRASSVGVFRVSYTDACVLSIGYDPILWLCCTDTLSCALLLEILTYCALFYSLC